MPPIRVIISGGGTGGHIFPAIAIAQGIKASKPDAEILFVGAKGKMEMEKVPAAGFSIEGLWISGIKRSLSLDNLAFPFKLISSLAKAKKIIKEFRPDVAIGVGGFASGPLLRVANSAGIKTLLQEQNSFPGITNKLLAKKANRICVAYEGMERWFPKEKIKLTGNPIRPQVTEISGKRERALVHFGLDPNKPIVLAIGGSLGARTINHALTSFVDQFEAKDVQIVWQTGKLYINEALELAKGNNHVKPHEFIKDMDLAYAAADVIISRAGAMSISELSLIGKPCILVPFPHAAEDHQTKNAQALVEHNAAILIPDNQAREKLESTLFDLLGNEEKRRTMSSNLKPLGMPNSTQDIVQEVFSLT